MIDIKPQDLVPINIFQEEFAIDVELVYANPDHKNNHFPNLYHPKAKILWVHKDLATITLLASNLSKQLYGWTLQLVDCLRTVDAQEGMSKYGYHPSLVSTPGSGAHPRAMAIDILALDEDRNLVEMGTAFDYFVDDPELDNPAARHYTKFNQDLLQNEKIWLNRQKLEFCMRYAATQLDMLIDPLAQEWWDFRFFSSKYDQYNALHESDLLPYQRLINPDLIVMDKILNGQVPEELNDAINSVSDTVKGIVANTI